MTPTDFTIYEYLTAPTGTVHLALPGDPTVYPVTLCGRRANDWEAGDETPSGVAATCRTCRGFAAHQRSSRLDCTCDGSESFGSYRVGCPRHTAAALAAGPYVSKPRAFGRAKTVYVGTCTVSRPVLGEDGNVWSQQEPVECGHEHDDFDEATKCAERLGRRLERDAR